MVLGEVFLFHGLPSLFENRIVFYATSASLKNVEGGSVKGVWAQWEGFEKHMLREGPSEGFGPRGASEDRRKRNKCIKQTKLGRCKTP